MNNPLLRVVVICLLVAITGSVAFASPPTVLSPGQNPHTLNKLLASNSSNAEGGSPGGATVGPPRSPQVTCGQGSHQCGSGDHMICCNNADKCCKFKDSPDYYCQRPENPCQ